MKEINKTHQQKKQQQNRSTPIQQQPNTLKKQNEIMDTTDIPGQVFQTICTIDTLSYKDTIQMIIEWNQTLDPSFNMVKGQFKKFMDGGEENVKALCGNVVRSLEMLAGYKCPRNFQRAYIATIKLIIQSQDSIGKKILLDNLPQYEKCWQTINPQVLQSYFEAFSLKQRVSQEQVNQFIEIMINTKKYNNCLEFIKFLGVTQNKENIQKLMAKMSNKRDASKAADYVKRLKLDPKNYPALGERLYKNTARHFLAKHGWQSAEEIFQQYPEALACIVQDLIYKKKFAQARSIWSRHPLWQYLQKEQSKQFLKLQQNEQILPNSILSNDIFGPPNKQRYLDLAEFGITENDVIFVDQQSNNLNEVLEDIANAEILGIDTESIVGQTKFQKVDEAAIIQISTGKKIYIFDGFKSNNVKIAEVMLECFDKTKIIGHSFTNDTEGILKAFGLKTASQVTIKNLVDICKVYKGLNQNTKYSSLAHICKQTLGKQLCKDQTLTNWKRRPLRKNQVHYAAMDAHVVIQVYNIWLKEYGEIVHYHAAMENDDI